MTSDQKLLTSSATTTLMDLSYKMHGVEELIQIFQILPPTITSINLHGNSLGNNTGEELVRIFQTLPPTITSIYLCGNDLHDKTGEELVRISQALPQKITSIDLSGNKLNTRVEELPNILLALPETVIQARLGMISPEEVEAIVKILPSTNITYNECAYSYKELFFALLKNKYRIEKTLLAVGQGCAVKGLPADTMLHILSFLPVAARTQTTSFFRYNYSTGTPIPGFDTQAAQIAIGAFYYQRGWRLPFDQEYHQLNALAKRGHSFLERRCNNGQYVAEQAEQLKHEIIRFGKKNLPDQKLTEEQFKKELAAQLQILSRLNIDWNRIFLTMIIAATVGTIPSSIGRYANRMFSPDIPEPFDNHQGINDLAIR